MGQGRAVSEDLKKLSEAIAKWRADGGGRGKKIPEELWNEAVRVARSDGVWRTAKATRLTYESLKRQIARAGGDGTTAPCETTAPPARERRAHRRRAKNRKRPALSSRRGARRREAEFVEVSPAQLLGAPSTKCTVVEVEDKAGVRIIVRLPRHYRVRNSAPWIVPLTVVGSSTTSVGPWVFSLLSFQLTLCTTWRQRAWIHRLCEPANARELVGRHSLSSGSGEGLRTASWMQEAGDLQVRLDHIREGPRG
jgi:hypothetical protein